MADKGLMHGLVGITLRTKTITVCLEILLEYGLQHLLYGLLKYPVYHCGNTQEARLSVGFRYFNTQYGGRTGNFLLEYFEYTPFGASVSRRVNRLPIYHPPLMRLC